MNMNRKQTFTLVGAVLLTLGLYFGIPMAKPTKQKTESQASGPQEAPLIEGYSTDTVLTLSKSRLTPTQLSQVTELEGKIPGDSTLKAQKVEAFHQLAHFWREDIRLFEPYIWYESEAARLENSEKSLTFAAHLLLDNLQQEGDENLRRWKAIQAKDLFERSLILNPKNDSARVGLGGCYLFGSISAMPMVGIRQIREVVQRDSAFVYGQMTLAKASLLSNQPDKAAERLTTIIRLQPNSLDAHLLLAEVREQQGDKAGARALYQTCLKLTELKELKKALEDRIQELSK